MSQIDNIMHGIKLSAMYAMRKVGDISVQRVVKSLSVEGTPKPFVAAPGGMPSLNWYDNMIDAISREVEEDGDKVILTVGSAAVDEYVRPSYHFSEDAERGNVPWDGRAYVPETGQIEQVAWPKEGEDVIITKPHPHMEPEFNRLSQDAARLLAENWLKII